MKKVAILAAPGFEEIELMAPLDILRRLNMDVVLAGVQSDKVVSTHEVTVSTDTMLDKLHADKLDALILPGGAGSWVLRDTPEVIHLVKKMHEAGKLVAAISISTVVENVSMDEFKSFIEQLKVTGASVSVRSVLGVASRPPPGVAGAVGVAAAAAAGAWVGPSAAGVSTGPRRRGSTRSEGTFGSDWPAPSCPAGPRPPTA